MNIDFSQKELRFLIKSLLMTYAEDFDDFDLNSIGDFGTRGYILGSIISQLGRDGREYYSEVKKLSINKDRFVSYLFMGAGKYSTVQMNHLFKRIRYAINEISTMQQMGGIGTSFDKDEYDRKKSNVVLVVIDVMEALGVAPKDILDHCLCVSKKVNDK